MDVETVVMPKLNAILGGHVADVVPPLVRRSLDSSAKPCVQSRYRTFFLGRPMVIAVAAARAERRAVVGTEDELDTVVPLSPDATVEQPYRFSDAAWAAAVSSAAEANR